MAAGSLRVLLVEDCGEDAELIQCELERGGFQVHAERVDTAAGLAAALDRGGWHLITCDYAMPTFSATAALALMRNRRVDVPILIVSGEVGEEFAVSAMQAGAWDYVSKHRLERLVPAVQRALRELEERRARERAEEALRESETRLRLAVECGAIALWDWSIRNCRVHFSPLWKRHLGYEDGEIEDRFEEWTSRLHPDDGERLIASIQTYLQTCLTQESPLWRFEYRLRHKDGTYRWVLIHASVRRDANGCPVRMLGGQLDITERKQAEEALRQSRAEMAAILNNSLQSFILLDGDARVRASNQIASTRGQILLGLPPLTTGYPLRESLPEPVRSELENAFGRAVRGEIVIAEHRIVDTLGAVHWFEGNYVPILDDANRITGVCLCLLDITDRKRAEQALRDSESKYRSLVETTSELIWETDRNGRFTFCNGAVEAILGYTPEQLRGEAAKTLLHEEDRRQAGAQLAELIAARRGWSGWVLRWRHRDGSYRALESNAVPILDAEGQLVGYRGTDRDITERLKIEAERARLSAAVEQAAEAILLLDAAGTIVYANPAAESMTGYRHRELLGQRASILDSPSRCAGGAPVCEVLARDGVWRGSAAQRHKDGSLIEVEAVVSAVSNSAGQVVNYVTLARWPSTAAA